MPQLFFTIIFLFSAIQGFTQDIKSNDPSRFLSNFDDQKPLFKLQNEQLVNKNRFMRYYALTGYREGLSPIKGPYNSNFKAQIDSLHGTHRIKMYNLSIQDMLTYGMISKDKVVLEVKDLSKYRYDPAYGDEMKWLRKNAYCFEIMMPIGHIKTMKVVLNELSRLFNVKCGYQKRLLKTPVTKNGVLTEEMKETEVFVITELN